ncbi:MAG: M48 family metalloprotease [Pyrodictiaceae archaeon]
MFFYWLWGFGWIVAGIIAGLITMVLAFSAPRIVSEKPPSPMRLHYSMLLTALSIIAVSAGLLWFIVEVLGYSASLLSIALLVGLFSVIQWLISPWMINAIYRVRPAGPELSWLEARLEELARRAGLRRPPRLVVAETRAPNAFAYGSPLAGYYVAVTRGLLENLPREEIIAVLGHELGHLRHRDVQAILALGLIPSIAYYLGIILLQYGFYGSIGRREERNSSPLVLLAIGVILVAVSIILHFLIRHFNRLREYYADLHSALVVGRARPLQRALARIYIAYKSRPSLTREYERNSALSMLFIVTPLVEMLGGSLYSIDSIIEELKREKPNPLEEVFSTHPPIQKRLIFLDLVERSLGLIS